jgi:2-polyprenyl-6-methoxyphenol hydroxylase-like FAD-dependent oxidoreductase
MVTALALARRGHRIEVIERDPPPPEGDADTAFFRWKRLGAAQFRHPHAFLGLMCNLIQDNYPELLERFYQAGARRLGLRDMLPAELEASYTPAPGDEKLWVLLCRRATMETVIRRYVETLPNITIRNRCHVMGFVFEEWDGVLVATGLTLRPRDGDDRGRVLHLRADLVIDASGRSSRFPAWLRALGRNVEEQKDDAEIVYYTRHYRLRPGEEEPPRRSENRSAGDLGYLKFGVFPGDNGHFAIILCVPVDEIALKAALTDPEQFDRICASIPGLAPWLSRSDSTTEPFGIGDIQAVWRQFVVNGEPLIHNFFAVGDAALRTNPLYGRGCSTGIMHAHLLADILAEQVDPRARALAFHARTAEILRPIFDASLREDRSGIKRARALMAGELVDRPDSLKKRFGAAFGDALAAAARERIHVLRGMMRTFHLLERPGDFLKEGPIRRTVFLYMLKGRKRNAAKRLQRGPSREEMLRLVEQQAPAGSAGGAPGLQQLGAG